MAWSNLPENYGCIDMRFLKTVLTEGPGFPFHKGTSDRWVIGQALLAVLLFSFSLSLQAAVILQGEMIAQKQAQPGESYRGTLVLNNPDPTPGEVKLYQNDYGFDAEGRTDFGEPGKASRSNANWITISREVVIVPPNSVVQVDYEVRVPDVKGLSGTYWSVIMVEPIVAASPEALGNDSEPTVQITQTLRYAFQVVAHIGKGGGASLAFSNPRVVVTDGNTRFTIDVENTGLNWLRPKLSLELYSQTGQPIGRFLGQASRLYPETSSRFEIALGDVPKGKYLGLVVADGTGDNLFGANVELDIE